MCLMTRAKRAAPVAEVAWAEKDLMLCEVIRGVGRVKDKGEEEGDTTGAPLLILTAGRLLTTGGSGGGVRRGESARV